MTMLEGNMKLITILLILFLLAPIESFGQKQTIMVWGCGHVSCAKFTEQTKKYPTEAVDEYGSWLYGYITGRNYEGSNISDYAGGIERTALMAWLSNYCKDHPLDSFFHATNELILELEKTGRVHKR
jgi:hypothetical protein